MRVVRSVRYLHDIWPVRKLVCRPHVLPHPLPQPFSGLELWRRRRDLARAEHLGLIGRLRTGALFRAVYTGTIWPGRLAVRCVR